MTNYKRSRKHRIAKSIGKFFGYVVAPLESLDEFGNVFWLTEEQSNTKKYEAIQKMASEKKYGLSWTKPSTCFEISNILKHIKNPAQSILCHGVRRGEELKYFSQAGMREVVGTDLYVPPGADDRIVECNMNAPQDAFDSRFDVVYSNSIDHAENPHETLRVWASQLNNHPQARIVLELDSGHGVFGASDLDVSGIDLQSFPFYLSVISNGGLYCDRVVRSKSMPGRIFYFITCGSAFVELES